jgi:hypothetical protein
MHVLTGRYGFWDWSRWSVPSMLIIPSMLQFALSKLGWYSSTGYDFGRRPSLQLDEYVRSTGDARESGSPYQNRPCFGAFEEKVMKQAIGIPTSSSQWAAALTGSRNKVWVSRRADKVARQLLGPSNQSITRASLAETLRSRPSRPKSQPFSFPFDASTSTLWNAWNYSEYINHKLDLTLVLCRSQRLSCRRTGQLEVLHARLLSQTLDILRISRCYYWSSTL